MNDITEGKLVVVTAGVDDVREGGLDVGCWNAVEEGTHEFSQVGQSLRVVAFSIEVAALKVG